MGGIGLISKSCFQYIVFQIIYHMECDQDSDQSGLYQPYSRVNPGEGLIVIQNGFEEEVIQGEVQEAWSRKRRGADGLGDSL